MNTFKRVAALFCVAFLSLFCIPPDSARATGDLTGEPDMVISTKSLAALPKDMISVPVLKDLLTEDFVFYYRDSGADWLSFRGALARIAFEKDTDWPTQLMAWLLSGPADVALWSGPEGKLSHFVVVIDQSGVKALFEMMAKAATNDNQLTTKSVGGRTVMVLKLSSQKSVYMTSMENRLIIFSDENMRLPNAASGRSFIDRAKSFFAMNDDIAVFGPKLGDSKHLITVSARYFALGYQAFFGALRALRFDFTSGAWESRALVNSETKSPENQDWGQMPRGAALCVAVPIEKKKIAALVKLESWLQNAVASALACWYPGSRLYSPLIALRGNFKSLLPRSDELKKVFTSFIGSREAVWVKGADENAPSTLDWKPMLPVRETKQGVKHVTFTREIGGRYGLYPADKSSDKTKLGSKRFFRVKLAVAAETIFFSPDDQLVDRGMTTLHGAFPSMAASLPQKNKSASFILAPEAFAKLAKESILDSLPESQEAIFRTAVSRHLFPNLDKFSKRPMEFASLGASTETSKGGASAAQWKKVEWTSNAAR